MGAGHMDSSTSTRVNRAGGKPTVRLKVDPGPQARIGRVQLEMQGAFAEAMQAGDVHPEYAGDERHRQEDR